MADRIDDFDSTWFRGVKSDSDPGQIPLGYAWNAVNMVNTGGLLGCRPGYRCIVQLPHGNLQGCRIFRPRLGIEQLVIVIDGIVYVADYPFTNFRRLENLLFSPTAKQIFWANTEQSASRLTPNDINSAIEIVPVRNVLIMQDGGITAPAFYDGSQSGHIRDNLYETPAGSAMRWVGDRLWVASGSFVYASDIANPFSFREQIYLGGVAAFVFSGDVTAMAITPSLEFPQLLVFTDSNTSLLKANIRDRSQWLTVEDMQREIFRVGCTSQRSVINHFGQLAWFSPSGATFFDAASVSKLASRLPIRDNEMMTSKTQLSEDLSLVAGAAHGQFMLFSVPAEDKYNKHTWVLNGASYETLNDDSGPSWCGYWLGTRPVEWAYGVIADSERAYHVSTDADCENRLWETFLPERLDNGCPITWAVETRGYFGLTSQKKQPGLDATFCYADIALVCVDENTDIAVKYAGGLRGAYKPILTKELHVARGSLHYQRNITPSSLLFGFKPQSRILRTEEVRLQDVGTETESCPVERKKLEDKDESFQLLIVGQGPATIRWIRAFAQPEREDQSADGEACRNETGENAIRFDGEGAAASTWDEVFSALQAKDVTAYESNKSATVVQNGQSAVGVGHADSIISQGTADRVATIVAVRAAESELLRVLPPTLSLGEGEFTEDNCQ